MTDLIRRLQFTAEEATRIYALAGASRELLGTSQSTIEGYLPLHDLVERGTEELGLPRERLDAAVRQVRVERLAQQGSLLPEFRYDEKKE